MCGICARSRQSRSPAAALTAEGDFYNLLQWVATRSEAFRLGISQSRGATQGGTRLIFFGRFFGFDGFRAILVAIPRHSCRVLATAALTVLAGCATGPGGTAAVPVQATPEANQALVAQRASARWVALVKDDLDTAYGYLSPGSRQLTSLDKFKANTRRGAFREGKIENVTCEADACMVKVLVTYDHPKMKGITTPVLESWIIDGGQAWYVYGGH